MVLGSYSNFPKNPHFIKSYSHTQTIRQLQQKIIAKLAEVNRKELTFEEVSNPTIPQAVVIFEFGNAEDDGFNYLSLQEAQKLTEHVTKAQVGTMDFFCSIRYYRGSGEERQALKFDYFMLRLTFTRGMLEVQVYHERGPLYLSAEDLVEFVVKLVNGQGAKAALKEVPTEL